MLAGRQARKDVLESSGLQEVLAWHVLPLLGINDIAAVACTCRPLKSAAYIRDEAWVSAAADRLSPVHPSFASMDRSAIQEALHRRLQARKNISSGQRLSSVEILMVVYVSKVQFSRCSTLLALETGGSLLAVFLVHD